MAVWSEFQGIVTVLQKDHISLEKVFNEIFKGSDKSFKIIDTNVGHTYYQYTINGSVDLEAQEFFPRWEEFAKKSKLFQCDVTLEMRWFD